MAKIRAIIKRPDEKYGHMTSISARMGNLQNIVGGMIETIEVDDIVILCNEEGKLLGLPENIPSPVDEDDMIVGTIIICSYNDEYDDFGGIKWDFAKWKKYLDGIRK